MASKNPNFTVNIRVFAAKYSPLKDICISVDGSNINTLKKSGWQKLNLLLAVYDADNQTIHISDAFLPPGSGWHLWWGPELCGNWRWVQPAGNLPGPSSSVGRSPAPGYPGWSSTLYGKQETTSGHLLSSALN